MLWGWAKPGQMVTVKLDGRIQGQTEAKGGTWSIELQRQAAGGPHLLTISGTNQVQVKDVYFGDVWIASGQSNMQTPMGRIEVKYPHEVATANYPQIRMFTAPGKYDFNTPAVDYSGGQWMSVGPKTIKSFSGVAYFFAKHLHVDTQIPIGIINSSFGGSPAQAWMSEEALKQFPHYLDAIKPFKDAKHLAKTIKSDQLTSNQWYGNLHEQDAGMKQGHEWYASKTNTSNWKPMEVPGLWEDNGLEPMNGVVWFKKDITLSAKAENEPAKLELGRIVNADTAYVNGVKVGGITYEYPPRRYDVPEGILKAGTNTITVRVVSNSGKGGFILDKPYHLLVGKQKIDLTGTWQYKIGTKSSPIPPSEFNQYSQPLGRYNAMLSPLLKTAFKGVIWYQGESNTGQSKEYAQLFPALIRDWRRQFSQGDFPFIFVQLANFMEAKSRPSESNWAETRDGQLKALSEPNTAMAVAIDAGEWNDIHPVDKKTVGDRLALAAKKLAYGNNRDSYSGPIFDTLQRRDDKLVLSFKHVDKGLTYRGRNLQGFAIKSKSGPFVWAKSRIKNNKVIVWSDRVETPVSVRYAWADNPDTANLYNKDGLPASPFQASIK